MPDIKETLIDLLTGYSLDTYEDVQYVADELIAKGVLPVVRCGQCKHWKTEDDHCMNLAGLCATGKKARNNYCSFGERKDGEG